MLSAPREAGPRLTRPTISNSGILWYARAWLAPMFPQPITPSLIGVTRELDVSTGGLGLGYRRGVRMEPRETRERFTHFKNSVAG